MAADLDDPVAALRDAFDRAFAEAPSAGRSPVDILLDVRCGTTRYALRMVEIARLLVDVRVTPLPTAVFELLGIAGIQGAVLPVYDLRAMLGEVTAAKPRWLAVAARHAVGLAFDRFEGVLRVPHDRIAPLAAGQHAGHVRDVVQLDESRPLVSIASVLEGIGGRGSGGT